MRSAITPVTSSLFRKDRIKISRAKVERREMASYQPIPQRAYLRYLSPSIVVLLLLTVLPVLFTLYLSTSSLSYASP